MILKLTCVIVVVALSLSFSAEAAEVKVVNVKLLDLCVPGAAPVHGSWQTVEKNIKKVCPPGSSCRQQACNCDDLADGTIMTHSPDKNGNQSCRRIAGQKCSSDDQCVSTAKCTGGVCTCPNKADCEDRKDDAIIMF